MRCYPSKREHRCIIIESVPLSVAVAVNALNGGRWAPVFCKGLTVSGNGLHDVTHL